MDIPYQPVPQPTPSRAPKVLLVLGALVAVCVLGYFVLYPKISQYVQVGFNRGNASGTGVALTLVVDNPVSVGQPFAVKVIMDTQGHPMTAAELHLSWSGQVTAQSMMPGASFQNNILTGASLGTTTASITVGSGTTPVNASGVVIAVLNMTAGTTPTSATFQIDATTKIAATDTGSANDFISAVPLTVAINPPAPTGTFTSSRSVVKTGVSVPLPLSKTTLSWSTTGTTVSIDQGVGSVNPIGTIDVSPTGNTTYTLTITNPTGTITKSVAVTTRNIANAVAPFDTPVDIFDYNALVGDYGQTGALPGDLDENLAVNLLDYNFMVANYGK